MIREGCLAIWTGEQWECASCGWTSPYDLFASNHGLSSMDLMLNAIEAPD